MINDRVKTMKTEKTLGYDVNMNTTENAQLNETSIKQESSTNVQMEKEENESIIKMFKIFVEFENHEIEIYKRYASNKDNVKIIITEFLNEYYTQYTIRDIIEI